MTHPLVSKRKAHHFCVGLLLICLGVIAYLDTWWPTILLALGLCLALRQVLLGKWYDGILVIIVFVGSFLSFFYHWPFLPILFFVAGIYLFFRDVSENEDEVEYEEEIQKEMEEDKD
ncbi:MAG: hypothetical protein JHC93_01070 [Parachlamydiales bacterium]|nr:hypothetical protein [Parachlamydiales bacterium]